MHEQQGFHLLSEALCGPQVRNLSGGELQRVALTLALGTPADIYLIDEPSAYLDSEQRIIAAKVLPPFLASLFTDHHVPASEDFQHICAVKSCPSLIVYLLQKVSKGRKAKDSPTSVMGRGK